MHGPICLHYITTLDFVSMSMSNMTVEFTFLLLEISNKCPVYLTYYVVYMPMVFLVIVEAEGNFVKQSPSVMPNKRCLDAQWTIFI